MTSAQETTLMIGRSMWSRRRDPSAVTIDWLGPRHMDHGNNTWNLQVNAADLCYPICYKWLCIKSFLIDATLLILLVSILVKVLLLLTMNKTLIILSIQNDSWPLLHKNNSYQLVWNLITDISIFTTILVRYRKIYFIRILCVISQNDIFQRRRSHAALINLSCLYVLEI